MSALADNINKTPFVRIVVPMAAGIVLARYFSVPWWSLGVALAVSYAMAWAGYRTREAWFYVAASILLTGMALGQMHRTPDPLPKGERLLVTFQVREEPAVRGRWARTGADVGSFRRETDPSGRWTSARTKILLWIDTCYRIETGAQYAALVYVNPVDTAASGYAALMHTRGFSGKAYVTPGRLLARSPHESRTPAYHARKLQASAARRLESLGLSADAHAAAAAMTVGDTRDMSPALKAAYARVGATHLLSVSGLHVAIVFSLVNILLYMLPAFRRGHVWKNLLAVAAIWYFAAISGFSPSVIRSACMFSGAQIAFAATRHRNPLNIMLATAAVMFAIDPNYLFDISFQLSFLAVLAILAAFGPLYTRLRTPYKLPNALISVTIVGVAATLGTAPLVAYQFGNFPIVGILINPVVIFTAHLVVMLTMLWILIPVPALADVFGWVIERTADLQNTVVAWSARFPWAATEVRIPLWAVFACYLAWLLLALWWYGRARQDTYTLSLSDDGRRI